MDKGIAANAVSQSLRLLIVDDDEVTRNLLKEVFSKENFEITLASSGEDALKILEKSNFSIVLSDIRMLEVDGMAILAHIKKAHPNTIVILMTGFGNFEGAVKAIKEGAFDYVSKPFKINDLRQLIQRAVKQIRTMKENALDVRTNYQNPKMLIGKTPQIVEVYKSLARASMSASYVLIEGESGTGKELVAKAIHENSARSNKSLLTVTCGMQSEESLEQELFGLESGAFLKATGGTLSIHGVDQLSLSLQIKLLRALQSEEQQYDVRLLVSSCKRLEELVQDGRFREDLYYRLKVIQINLPPLRERLEDLPELVSYFISYYAQKNKKNISHISDETMGMLKKYSWPGNVRELEYAIERAVALSNAAVLFPEDFSLISKKPQNISGTKKSLDEVEREHILKVLKEVQFNKSKASEVLGIDRATLYRKAQKFGIELKSEK